MKKTFIFLLFAILFALNSFSQKTPLQQAADELSGKILKELKRNKGIPVDSKIAICLFLGQDEYSDTLKTRLGIRLAQKISHSLSIALKKTGYEAVFPDALEKKFLNDAMSEFFVPPATSSEESKFWSDFLMKQKPNYYLTGKYKIIDNYKYLKITGVFLRKNVYAPDERKINIGIENIKDIPISSNQADKLKKLNIELNVFSKNYNELVYWKGKANLFEFALIDYNKKSLINTGTPLYIGNEYQVEINLNQSAYVYAFFYDPQDKEHPYFSMIYPIDNKSSNFLQKGRHKIPVYNKVSSTFEITPPEGEVYIKIIASIMKIPIEFTKFKDKEGALYIYFKDNNCRKFLEKLNALPKSNVDAKSVVKVVKDWKLEMGN